MKEKNQTEIYNITVKADIIIKGIKAGSPKEAKERAVTIAEAKGFCANCERVTVMDFVKIERVK